VVTFGRCRVVAVTQLAGAERDARTDVLAGHCVCRYGAPSLGAARPVAEGEIAQMSEMCDDRGPNPLLTVARELTEAGVRETYRSIEAQDAGLEQFAIHGSLDD